MGVSAHAGHSGHLTWIVPRDVAFWFGELLIRPRGGTEIHAEQLFNQAFQPGFGVSSEGIAKLDHSICCFVFAPDDADDAAANFVEPPLTMKVRQELKTAQEPGSVLWWLAGRLSSKRARSQALQYFGHDLDRRTGTPNAGLEDCQVRLPSIGSAVADPSSELSEIPAFRTECPR